MFRDEWDEDEEEVQHEMLNSFEEKTLYFHAFHVMPVALDCSLNLCAPFFLADVSLGFRDECENDNKN